MLLHAHTYSTYNDFSRWHAYVDVSTSIYLSSYWLLILLYISRNSSLLFIYILNYQIKYLIYRYNIDKKDV